MTAILPPVLTSITAVAGITRTPAVFTRDVHARLFLPGAVHFFPFRIADKSLRSGAALAVDAAAGLYAAAAQAAFATHIAGPVTTAGNTIAQRAVHKAFKVKPFGAGFTHEAYFINRKFARQNNTAGPKLFCFHKGAGMGEVGQGRKKNAAFKTGLTRQIKYGKVLHDKAIGAHLICQPLDKAVGGGRLVRLDERIHGHVNAGIFGMGQIVSGVRLDPPGGIALFWNSGGGFNEKTAAAAMGLNAELINFGRTHKKSGNLFLGLRAHQVRQAENGNSRREGTGRGGSGARGR